MNTTFKPHIELKIRVYRHATGKWEEIDYGNIFHRLRNVVVDAASKCHDYGNDVLWRLGNRRPE